MLPVSHVLSGFLAGRCCRLRLTGAGPCPLRDPLVVAAVAGSVLPDIDVLPGLIAGFSGTTYHRTATHSIAGALIQAVILGGVAALLLRVLRRPRPARAMLPLVISALAGVLTHVFWDFLNPWRVALLWPASHSGMSLPLVHEGDLWVAGILLVCSALTWSGRERLGIGLAAALLASYLGVAAGWRWRAESLARQEFAGRQVRIYPSPRLSCPWLVLARLPSELVAGCVSHPLATRIDELKRVPLRRDDFVAATERLPEVTRFKRREFPFAEVRRQDGGDTLVIWRDLRESLAEGDSSSPAGLYIRFSPSGRIAGIRYEWLLRPLLW